MKKLTLFSVLAVLCLFTKLFGQSNAIDIRNVTSPLYVDDWIDQNIPLGKFINFKENTATLSDFKDKLVIIGFWFTSCGSCIKQFPKENSLQKLFDKELQLIMVTYEPEQKVTAFIKNWEQKNNTSFNLPIIVEDTVLRAAFHQLYNPNYVWILPDGKMVAQTSEHFINAECIESMLQAATKRKVRKELMKSEKFNSSIR